MAEIERRHDEDGAPARVNAQAALSSQQTEPVEQPGVVRLWALVDPTTPRPAYRTRWRLFRSCGLGLRAAAALVGFDRLRRRR
jgi:hypothetical protein